MGEFRASQWMLNKVRSECCRVSDCAVFNPSCEWKWLERNEYHIGFKGVYLQEYCDLFLLHSDTSTSCSDTSWLKLLAAKLAKVFARACGFEQTWLSGFACFEYHKQMKGSDIKSLHRAIAHPHAPSHVPSDTKQTYTTCLNYIVAWHCKSQRIGLQ